MHRRHLRGAAVLKKEGNGWIDGDVVLSTDDCNYHFFAENKFTWSLNPES
jgi:hypothetical protein